VPTASGAGEAGIDGAAVRLPALANEDVVAGDGGAGARYPAHARAERMHVRRRGEHEDEYSDAPSAHDDGIGGRAEESARHRVCTSCKI
jgi:hypothetical protein